MRQKGLAKLAARLEPERWHIEAEDFGGRGLQAILEDADGVTSSP